MNPTTSIAASRFGALALGAVALGCAGIAAFIASDMMPSRYAKTKVMAVVVAKEDLKVGESITATDVELRDWPVESVPSGAISRVADLLDSFETVTPTVGILTGEPVVRSRLSNAKHGTGVAALVAPQMRAIALEVDASVAETGLVYPGAFVDVIVTFRDHDGQGPTATTAVQHAQVLSVGLDVDVATRQVHTNDSGSRLGRRDTTYVTLEVSPEEAEIVGIARNEGRIDLSLRDGGDDAIVNTPGARPINLIPELVIEEEPEELEIVSDARETEPRSRRTRRRGRRIRLIANKKESPKRESPRIETYRAN